MAKILVVDDDEKILKIIQETFLRDKHKVKTYSSAKAVPEDELSFYDLILLDVMMPEIDGFDFCKKIRDLTDCPIIFLTAKVLSEDIQYGLGIGGDDYITKPFRVAELRARVSAHLRREKREKKFVLKLENISLDLHAKNIYIDTETDNGELHNEKLNLTKSEYSICEFLAKHRNQVFSKEDIYEAVFGLDGESDTATISTHIKNIRSKMNAKNVDPIETMWGIGYKWK